MMQDYVRTGTYQRAILQNHSDFKDKVSRATSPPLTAPACTIVLVKSASFWCLSPALGGWSHAKVGIGALIRTFLPFFHPLLMCSGAFPSPSSWFYL